VIILTEGGPFRSTETIMFYYYIEAFKSGNRAVQNTLSVLMTLIFILSMAIYSRRRSGNEKRT
jgi:sn-glycerol 3-phosphate transport system permease protein